MVEKAVTLETVAAAVVVTWIQQHAEKRGTGWAAVSMVSVQLKPSFLHQSISTRKRLYLDVVIMGHLSLLRFLISKLGTPVPTFQPSSGGDNNLQRGEIPSSHPAL